MTLILLHVFSTFAPGGPEVRATEIMNSLAPQFRHLISSIEGRMQAAERISPAVAVQLRGRLGRGRRVRQGGALLTRIRSMLHIATELLLSLDLLLRAKPHLTLCYGLGACPMAFAARLLQAPYVWLEDGFESCEAHRRLRRRNWLRKLAATGAAAIVVPSRALREFCLRELHLKEAQVVYVPNGVCVERFAPASQPLWRRRLGLDGYAMLVGTVCHLRGEKRLDLLLEAAALSPESVHFLIAGAGPCDRVLKKQVESLNLSSKVTFLGDQADVRPVLHALDLFVSCSDTEQMPLSVLEAMACAKPVIVTNVGDCSEMIGRSEFPFVIPPNDSLLLARAITAALSRTDLDQIGRQNRERCERRYSSEAMIRSHQNLYTKLATKARRSKKGGDESS